MPKTDPELSTELRQLCRGRGLQDDRLTSRIGSQVRKAYGLSEAVGPTELKKKLISGIEADAAEMSPDQAELVLRMLNVRPTAKYHEQRFLDARIETLAAARGVNRRTVSRLTAPAFHALAGIAAARLAAGRRTLATGAGAASRTGPAEDSADGWYVSTFRALLRLDRPSPELMEYRSIVFLSDNLGTIDGALSLPRVREVDEAKPHGIHAEMLYGGQLLPASRAWDTHFPFTIRLPGTFRAGDRHDYAMLFRVPVDQPMCRHYAFVPMRDCELFELRVKFDPQDLPTAIYHIDGAGYRVLEDPRPDGDQLTLDEVGELSLSFTAPRCGRAYGIRWF